MKKLIIFLTLLFLFSCAGSQTRTTTVDFTCNCPDDREFSAQDVAKIVKFALEAIQKAPFLQSKAYLEKNPRWMLAKDMKNDTDEHINTRIILEKIRTNLMRENGIPFVDDEALRSILINKKYQESDLFNQDVLNKVGQLAEADVLLSGQIAGNRQRNALIERVYYQVSFQLVSLTTSKVLWMDQMDIIKEVPIKRMNAR